MTMKVNEVIFYALFVAFLWGLTPVIHKHVLNTLDPRTVMVLGSIFYFACVLMFWLWNREIIKNDVKNVKLQHIYWIAITSIVTAFIANVIYLFILKKHDSYIISALIYSCPIFTLVLAYIFLKEHITFTGLIGVFLITAGVACLGFNGSSKERFGDRL